MIIKIQHCEDCYTLQDGMFKPCGLYKIEFVLGKQDKDYWYHDDTREREEAKRLFELYGDV